MESGQVEITQERLKQIVATLERRVSFDQIASYKNIEITYEELGQQPKGFCEHFDGQWYICLKQGLTEEEREITLGHELAHAWLHIKNDSLAESFAAEMLFEKRLTTFFESVKASIENDAESRNDRILESFASLYLLQTHLIDDRKKGMVNAVIIGIGAVALIRLLIAGAQVFMGWNPTSKGLSWMPSLSSAGYTPASQVAIS